MTLQDRLRTAAAEIRSLAEQGLPADIDHATLMQEAADALAPPTFKVGDRVRVARKSEADDGGNPDMTLWMSLMDATLNECGNIDKILDGDLHVSLDSDESGWWYPAESLDLIASAG